ncbi:MAG: TolC family protein [Bacteroidetes bacterium]|nr:MAG: TolC family protein [Bacteroidota bacterium]
MKLSFLLIISILTVAQAQTTIWTLDYCIEKAIENNIQVKRSVLSQNNAKANSHQSMAQLLPTVNASANHSYNFGRNINPVTNSFQESNIQGNQFSINASLPIFNGLQTQFRIRETKINLQASKEEIKQNKNEVMLQVTSAYLQVLFQSELLKAARWQLENAITKATQMEKSVEAGIIAKNQLLEVQSMQATDELNATNAENNLELSKLSLRQLMLLPAEMELELSIQNSEPETINLDNTEEIYASASKEMPAPRQANLLIESAKFREYSAKNSRLPKLNLYAGILSNYAQVLGQNNQFSFQEQLNNNLGKYVQLRLDVPIFNAWQSKTIVQTAVVNRKNAELNAVEVQNTLRQDIEKAYLNKKTAYKRYIASQKQVELMKETFRMAEQKLAVGTISMIDFGTLKNRTSSAESDYLRAKYDYIFKTKILDFYKNTAP